MAKPQPPKIFERMKQAADDGGYKVDDKEGLKSQRGVVWEFVRSLGSNLMNGGAELTRTPFPVYINQPRSYLESIADGWVTAPHFLAKAVEAKDPLERLKLVITFVYSGLHMTVHSEPLKKPFNPILGETYQGCFPDGTQIFCEQTSHHPPITAWLLIGPNNSWRLSGSGEWVAAFRGNSIKAGQKGTLLLTFADGGKITYSLPQVNVGGVLWGDRIIEYDGSGVFKDEANKLSAELFMPIPNQGGWVSSWFAKKHPSDHFVGDIARDGKPVCHVEGSWLGAIEFDGQRYWTHTDTKLVSKHERVKDDLALPSDVRHREDMELLRQGDAKAAATAKVKLEEAQRRDAKLRKEAKAKRGVLVESSGP